MARWLVKEVAERRGFNRYRLAKDAELEYNTVHGIWTGKTTRVDLETLAKLARVLGVAPRDLIGNGEEENEERLALYPAFALTGAAG